MMLLKQHLYWYDLVQSITNQTPTSQGTSPYTPWPGPVRKIKQSISQPKAARMITQCMHYVCMHVCMCAYIYIYIYIHIYVLMHIHIHI